MDHVCLRVQVSEHEHVDLDPAILQFTNHSCDPSAFFNTADRVLEALRDLQPGDEVGGALGRHAGRALGPHGAPPQGQSIFQPQPA